MTRIFRCDTVDASEFRASFPTWDGHKTLLINGISTTKPQLVIPEFQLSTINRIQQVARWIRGRFSSRWFVSWSYYDTSKPSGALPFKTSGLDWQEEKDVGCF